MLDVHVGVTRTDRFGRPRYRATHSTHACMTRGCLFSKSSGSSTATVQALDSRHSELEQQVVHIAQCAQSLKLNPNPSPDAAIPSDAGPASSPFREASPGAASLEARARVPAFEHRTVTTTPRVPLPLAESSPYHTAGGRGGTAPNTAPLTTMGGRNASRTRCTLGRVSDLRLKPRSKPVPPPPPPRAAAVQPPAATAAPRACGTTSLCVSRYGNLSVNPAITR